ncbi:MAG: thioesterase family protein [Myxococcales bacterium]|nr:thioesterase family protein [Myxococcales bacterium]
MIGYLFRTGSFLARAAVSSRAPVSRRRMRVRLGDVDTNLHMNQAAYARVAELGRVDWLVRSGALKRWRGAGCNPIVAEQRLIYRRELRPLQRYVIDTRAVVLDGRLLRVDHHLLVGDQVHTVVEVKLLLVGPDGVLPADRVQELCRDLLAPALVVESWTVRG